MSVHIDQPATSTNFHIDILDGRVIVSLHDGCNGMLSTYITDDTIETVEITLQHDSVTCPVHEQDNDDEEEE